MTVQSAAEQIRNYLDEQEMRYSTTDDGDWYYFEYEISLDECRLGPVSCCILVSDEDVICETLLEPEVCIQRRKEVGELVLRLNDLLGEDFSYKLDKGTITHYYKMNIQFDGSLSEEMLEKLVGWGVHVFVQYNSVFYAVMMNDADPKYVVDCLGGQDVEFLPNGRLRWFTKL